ncbi:MAG: hypothetical protein ACI8UP_005464, partial [Porticoccaceae bacterium]
NKIPIKSGEMPMFNVRQACALGSFAVAAMMPW